MKQDEKMYQRNRAVVERSMFYAVANDMGISAGEAGRVVAKEIAKDEWLDDFTVATVASLILDKGAYYEVELGDTFQLRCPELEELGGILGAIVLSFEK